MCHHSHSNVPEFFINIFGDHVLGSWWLLILLSFDISIIISWADYWNQYMVEIIEDTKGLPLLISKISCSQKPLIFL